MVTEVTGTPQSGRSQRANLLSAVLLVGLVVCGETELITSTGDRMSHLTAGTDNRVCQGAKTALCAGVEPALAFNLDLKLNTSTTQPSQLSSFWSVKSWSTYASFCLSVCLSVSTFINHLSIYLKHSEIGLNSEHFATDIYQC